MMDAAIVDRCGGVLIGLAAGDRIGGPIRMALRLAESLIARGGFDPADVLERYVRWWREGAFDTGPVSDRALALVAGGILPGDAARRVHRELDRKTAGCNPAHRSSPLSMLATIAGKDLTRHAMADAGLTHFDPMAGRAAAAVNEICRSLIRGVRWENAVRRRFEFTAGDGPGGAGGHAPVVLRAAVFFAGTSASFAEALKRSLAFAGPANYSPVLVGAIAGARWGASAIPASSLAHVEILPRIRAAAKALAATWRQ